MNESLSLSAMYRIMKRAGCELVSDTAKIKLAQTLEKLGIEIVKDAYILTKHAGRKTIKSKDIDVAVTRLYYTKKLH